MTPRFSILLCVKDRIDKLRVCIDSLRPLTTEASGELVIVCDGGPAGIREAAGPLLSENGWTSTWLDVPAGGPAKARNAALAHCRGELILFLNDDVRCEPGLLRGHDRLHRDRPGHAVLGNTRWAPEVINSEFMHWVAHHDSFYYLFGREWDATWEYFHTLNASLDRVWFDRGARFDESFPAPAFEDTEFGYRLWNQGLRVGMAFDAFVYHVHEFRFEEYLGKSRMRGGSARNLVRLHPELEGRLVEEYRQMAARLDGWKGVARRLTGRLDALEIMEARIAREFLAGYHDAG